MRPQQLALPSRQTFLHHSCRRITPQSRFRVAHLSTTVVLGGRVAKIKRLPPIHPGEILREDFMKPLRISMNRLALDLRVPVTRIAEIVHERRGITPDTALRLGRYFNTSARFWMNAPIQLRPEGRARRTAANH